MEPQGNEPGRCFGLCGKIIARTRAREHVFAKPAPPRHLFDLRPLLPAARMEVLMDESTSEGFRGVFTTPVDRPPDEPRGRTPAMKERFAISW